MQKDKKQSFMQGAMILVAGTLIAKLISAGFKIPLQHLIGDIGMGIFNTAYQYYTVMFVVATAGVPVALSKLISEAYALGRGREVRKIARLAGMLFIALGAFCSLVLYFGAGWISGASNNPMALLAIRAIAPAVFFVSVIAVIRGYFQGLSNMTPTALSQIVEAGGKVTLGLFFAARAAEAGMGNEALAAFAILGVTAGEALAALTMIGYAVFGRKLPHSALSSRECRSNSTLFRVLLMTVIPITLTGSVTSLTTLVDTAMIVGRLQENGFSLKEANALYGVYTGQAFTMVNFPQTLITALATAVLPALAGAYAQRNKAQAAKNMGSAMRIAMLIALPSCVGYLVLSHPIINLLFKQTIDPEVAIDPQLGGWLLRVLALAIPCVALVGLSNAILQAIGQVRLPVLTMLLGGVLKIVLNYTLVGHPKINIYGAPVGTIACYTLIAALNLLWLRQFIQLPPIDRLLIRPLLACAGMGASARIVYYLLNDILSLSAGTAVLGAILAAGVVYVLLLLALGAVEREDILLLPAGSKLVRLLRIR